MTYQARAKVLRSASLSNDSTLQRSPMISFDSTVQRPAREWSRGDASDIDGQIERSKRAGANESKLSEFNALTNPWHAKASATAARGESHWIDPCLLGVR